MAMDPIHRRVLEVLQEMNQFLLSRFGGDIEQTMSAMAIWLGISIRSLGGGDDAKRANFMRLLETVKAATFVAEDPPSRRRF